MKTLSLYTATEWLAQHLLPCFYNQVFGISCPMCGCQRGALLLLRGDVGAALVQFPPLAAWAASAVVALALLSRRRLTRHLLHILLLINLFVLLCNGVYQNCQ
ncbi:MAG: DUF2752 domain-containing protein [Bacteroidales bacterium]|nr:DUF2752 domain-containing protein [Bacteroidales bacterium]